MAAEELGTNAASAPLAAGCVVKRTTPPLTGSMPLLLTTLTASGLAKRRAEQGLLIIASRDHKAKSTAFERADIDRAADDPVLVALIFRNARGNKGVAAGIDCRAARQQRNRLRCPAVVAERAQERILANQVAGAGNRCAGVALNQAILRRDCTIDIRSATARVASDDRITQCCCSIGTNSAAKLAR